MREIKFRVLDEVANEMYFPGTDSTQLNFGLNSLNWSLWSEDGEICNGRDEAFVMQYTGLKDKNGVEIYEGDILEYYDLRKGVFIFKEQPKRRAAIRWSQNDAQYRIPDMGFRIDTDKVEVIGNIYQHPHLMEVSE